MIPNLYIGNGCFTKHPFINGCLGFQEWVITNLLIVGVFLGVNVHPLIRSPLILTSCHGTSIRLDLFGMVFLFISAPLKGWILTSNYMGVSKNHGKTPQIIHLFIGFPWNKPFILGFFPLFLDTSISDLQLRGYVSEILLMVQKSQTTTWDGAKTL